MATSGSWAFNPPTGDLIASAYARIKIRRAQLLQEHFVDAQRELNFWLSSISNLGPNLFTVDLISEPLIQGTATYNVLANTIMILAPYVDTGTPAVSRIITPLSITDYAAMPDKTQQGAPTSFWFNRQINPTITLWPVPDGNGPYTLKYYRYRQMQDANLQNAENVELPNRFLDAMVAALSYRLSRIYATELEAARKMDAKEAWDVASTQDTENVPISIAPGIGSYFQ